MQIHWIQHFAVLMVGLTIMGWYASGDTNQVELTRSTFKGAILTVKMVQKGFHLGKPIGVSASLENVGPDMLRVSVSKDCEDVRAWLYDSKGALVTFADKCPDISVNRETEEIFTRTGITPPPKDAFVGSRAGIYVPPGDSISRSVNLQQMIPIKQIGIYYLVLAQRITSWERGYVVSNKVKFEVVE